jgi:hypothetical protein
MKNKSPIINKDLLNFIKKKSLLEQSSWLIKTRERNRMNKN